jgi:hypothetical protein
MTRYLVLSPAKDDTRRPWRRIDFVANGTPCSIVAPHEEGVRYLIRVRDQNISSFACEGFEARECSRAGAWAAWFRRTFLTAKDFRGKYEGLDLYFSGKKSARRAIRGVIRRLRRSGAPIDGPAFAKFPELLTGWKTPPAALATVPAPKRPAAIVAHVFHADVWDEMLPVLASVQGSMDIIITAPRENAELGRAIKKSLPNARIYTGKNAGRDVGPFLFLLEQGVLDGYAWVCKVHTKKSSDGGRSAALGTVWRNRMLFDLLAAPGAVEKILARFQNHPRVGMIGPRAYRYPSSLCDETRSWGGNRARVLELALRLGSNVEKFRLDFFCGTMFWVRPEALLPLRRLALSYQFREDAGLIDGGLEHAVERLFTASVEQARFQVEGVSGLDLTFSKDPL